MKPITTIKGIAASLFEANIDTDVIIPSREMKLVSKTGLSEGLFAGRRYKDFETREPNPLFILNQPTFAAASILLADQNFGCGSSREHAVWALLEYGIKAIVAPSFSSIFYKNCINNGLLPVALKRDHVIELVTNTAQELTIDLGKKTVSLADRPPFKFEINNSNRAILMQGLDPIDQTLLHSEKIDAFEKARQAAHPWAVL